jgi:hypothetical protein
MEFVLSDSPGCFLVDADLLEPGDFVLDAVARPTEDASDELGRGSTGPPGGVTIDDQRTSSTRQDVVQSVHHFVTGGVHGFGPRVGKSVDER